MTKVRVMKGGYGCFDSINGSCVVILEGENHPCDHRNKHYPLILAHDEAARLEQILNKNIVPEHTFDLIRTHAKELRELK